MSPDYIEILAQKADPKELWKKPVLERYNFTIEERVQLDTAVALRRYAEHVKRVQELIGTNKSLLITPLSMSGTSVLRVPTPKRVKKHE